MTENHHYNTPRRGDENWGIPLNENFEQLDIDIEIRDIRKNLLEYQAKPGAKFLAVDTGEIFIGGVGGWSLLPMTGPTPTLETLSTKQLSETHTFQTRFNSLQDAVDNTTGILHLPPGVLEVDNPITLPDGIRIEGCGTGTALVPLNDDHLFYADQIRYPSLSDLRVFDRDQVTSGDSSAFAVDSWDHATLSNLLVEQYATAYRIRTTTNSHSTERGQFVNLSSYYCRENDMLVTDSVQDNNFLNLTFWSDPGVGNGGGLKLDRTMGPVTGQHGGNKFSNVKIIGSPQHGLELTNWDQVWFHNLIIDGVDNGHGVNIRTVGKAPKQIYFLNVWSNVNGKTGIRIQGAPGNWIEDIQMTNFAIGTNQQEGMKLGYVKDSVFQNGVVHDNEREGMKYNNSIKQCQFSGVVFRDNNFYSIDSNSHGIDNRYQSVATPNGFNEGKRALIDGWGVNKGDPNTTGDWTGNGVEGCGVVDSVNSAKYVYRNGKWF